MSVIRTWKQYDAAILKLGCGKKYEDRHRDTQICYAEEFCDECGRRRFCPKCHSLIDAIEQFELKQVSINRATYWRKKAGGK